MATKSTRNVLLGLVATLGISVPAYAADDVTKTGIAAGLGVAAASGKTTMGDSAGAIEASLLDSDAMLQAGAAIRRIAEAARSVNGNRPVLVLGSGLVDQSQKMTVAARAMADKKTVGHLS